MSHTPSFREGSQGPTINLSLTSKMFFQTSGASVGSLDLSLLTADRAFKFPNSSGMAITSVDEVQPAIDAASSGEVIIAGPGTYDEDIIMKDGVNVQGVDREKCKLIVSRASNTTILKMAQNSVFENFTIEGTATGGALVKLIQFPAGDSNKNSTVRDVTARGISGDVLPMEDLGTGIVSIKHNTIENCIFVGSGLAGTFGCVRDNTGASRYVGCRFDHSANEPGFRAKQGTTHLLGCTMEFGLSGSHFTIDSGALAIVDAATTWESLKLDGTLSRLGHSIAPPLETFLETGVIGIASGSDTILITLTFLPAQKQRAHIVFSGNFRNTGSSPQSVTLKLFRDGVEVNTADQYIEDVLSLNAKDDNVIAPHWIDSSPGANPVYTIRARGSTSVIDFMGGRCTAWI